MTLKMYGSSAIKSLDYPLFLKLVKALVFTNPLFQLICLVDYYYVIMVTLLVLHSVYVIVMLIYLFKVLSCGLGLFEFYFM